MPPAQIERVTELEVTVRLFARPIWLNLFFNDRQAVCIIGGNWVFVLDATGEFAMRRDIRVGRRNNRYVEVREGLQEGEQVITSSYSQMDDMERIQLTQ